MNYEAETGLPPHENPESGEWRLATGESRWSAGVPARSHPPEPLLPADRKTGVPQRGSQSRLRRAWRGGSSAALAPRTSHLAPYSGVFFPLVLFAVNLGVCYRLFSLEYIQFMNSVEGVYVGLARHIAHNWPDLWWYPFWLNGVPYQNTYVPLLHFVVAGVSVLLNISCGFAFHAVLGFFYCLGPVCAYWLALRLSGSRFYSFWAGLAWSLVSPSAWLIPSIANELGSPWNARRLETLSVYGDGPHVAALSLVPAAIALLDVALEKRRPLHYLLAALSMAAVVLTNWVGATVLGIAFVCYLLAAGSKVQSPKSKVKPRFRLWALDFGLWTVWLPALAVALLAYVIASPWIPPSTIRTFQFNAQTTGGDFSGAYRTLLKLGPFVLLALAMLKFALSRARASRFVQFSLFFLFITGTITLLKEWANIALTAQPDRLHLAMELALCLAGAALAQMLIGGPWSPARGRWHVARGTREDAGIRPRTGGHRPRIIVACLFVLAAGVQFVNYSSYARRLLRPIDMNQRIEYRIARWLDEHMQGRRVMVSGGPSYWLNAFSDVQQLSGIEHGSPNWMNRIATYTIVIAENAGERDAEISVLWMKAFGVHAVEVPGPLSEGFYKPYVRPRKFEGVLEPMWRDGDDTIYRVPARSLSLAHGVLRTDLVDRPPAHGLDVERVRRYVAALDDPDRPLAPFAWRSNRSAQIVANLKPEHLLSVQITYHPGWHATVNGEPRRIFSDGIGLMAIEPKCNGPCTVNLYYDGGWEMTLARLACWGALAFMLAWMAFDARKK